jgi:hypothetical protein
MFERKVSFSMKFQSSLSAAECPGETPIERESLPRALRLQAAFESLAEHLVTSVAMGLGT